MDKVALTIRLVLPAVKCHSSVQLSGYSAVVGLRQVDVVGCDVGVAACLHQMRLLMTTDSGDLWPPQPSLTLG